MCVSARTNARVSAETQDITVIGTACYDMLSGKLIN